MKKMLLFIGFLLLCMNFYAQSIPFDQYGNVLLPDYENYGDNQTVTIVLTVSNAGSSAAPGWGIGEIVPIGNYEVKNYNFTCKEVSEEGAANEYEFTIADLKAFAKVDGEYYVDGYDQKGITINVYNGATLTAITVGESIEPSAIIDFEGDAIGAVYSGIAWGAENISATVEADPSGSGNSLHVTTNNWNAYPKFTIIFPEEKTVEDIEKVKFDIYLGTGGSSDQNSYKSVDYFIGGKDAAFTPNSATGTVKDLIATEPVDTWIAKEIPVSTADAGLLALNTFDFGMGVLVEKADYYLDNIQFILKDGTSIPAVEIHTFIVPADGGIIVNAYNQLVSVYGVDGRMLRQVISRGQIIPLEKGVYIVKAGMEKAEKVLVR